MLKDLVSRSRSIRRYDESVVVSQETLRELVNLARLCPSEANLQALRFRLVTEVSEVDAVFGAIRFAAYLKDWAGPQPGERPSAYILLMGDTRIKRQFNLDAGIVAQTIMLGAVEKGLGGCMMGSFDRLKLTRSFKFDPRYEIVLVLAIGKPAEKVVLEDVAEGKDIKYYRDAEGVHHVPKRSLDDLIL